MWESEGRPTYGEVFLQIKASKRQYKYSVRRLKRVNDQIVNQKFVTSLLGGGGASNIFHEIRKFRGSNSTCTSRMDNEVGGLNIANLFGDIYAELYSRVELAEEFEDVSNNIKAAVTDENIVQIERVNVDIVKEALNHLKSNKHDAYFTVASDS